MASPAATHALLTRPASTPPPKQFYAARNSRRPRARERAGSGLGAPAPGVAWADADTLGRRQPRAESADACRAQNDPCRPGFPAQPALMYHRRAAQRQARESKGRRKLEPPLNVRMSMRLCLLLLMLTSGLALARAALRSRAAHEFDPASITSGAKTPPASRNPSTMSRSSSAGRDGNPDLRSG
jgi:hypothetical protein